ncbi:MAG: iron-sulfur cluster-binding protein [Chromatiaceae bacterium]|nr:iron-sulfur cluster-binding protein [Gammaproteobacteria bacterium]MCP5300181.1 iron-sulfur cluster-binding protein [Chromatiaceae bacterium]MCP5422253.1 iron-sulfur cluster-binding protein [Chromatiaceae bacterium]
MNQTEAFHRRIDAALHNDQLRRNFRSALTGIMARRAEQFPDDAQLQALRDQARAVRANALVRQPELLERLERQLTANGIQVHWAEGPDEANAIIHEILARADATSVVKGKSMVSEETGLNHYLEQRGIDVIESDLGEYIIQLAEEPPSHIVAPAIHKNRREVAELFHRFHPEIPYTDDIDQLTQTARAILRDRFATADAGISGVNFAVAETGTLCLVENEGNGRLSTTAPRVHIAITGVEKVIEKLSDVPPLLEILTKSATGQPITTYFNMISKPRQPGELDGPEAVHLVLLDNGRSRIRVDAELLDTLRCIRCGACINHCPVYVQLGGHAYGTVYPGPIGIALEPQRIGIDKVGTLTSACTLCGACGEVCPVRIPLPTLINRLRAEAVDGLRAGATVRGHGSLRKPREARLWGLWAALYGDPTRYRLFIWLASRLRWLTPPWLGAWTRYRSAPRPAARTLRELARDEGFRDE